MLGAGASVDRRDIHGFGAYGIQPDRIPAVRRDGLGALVEHSCDAFDPRPGLQHERIFLAREGLVLEHAETQREIEFVLLTAEFPAERVVPSVPEIEYVEVNGIRILRLVFVDYLLEGTLSSCLAFQEHHLAFQKLPLVPEQFYNRPYGTVAGPETEMDILSVLQRPVFARSIEEEYILDAGVQDFVRRGKPEYEEFAFRTDLLSPGGFHGSFRLHGIET